MIYLFLILLCLRLLVWLLELVLVCFIGLGEFLTPLHQLDPSLWSRYWPPLSTVSSVCFGFWHVTLASDPRSFPRKSSAATHHQRIRAVLYKALITDIVLFSWWLPIRLPADLAGAFESFLPTLFFCYAFYHFAYRWVLPAFNNRIFERTIWFYGPFWVFLLSNVSSEDR